MGMGVQASKPEERVLMNACFNDNDTNIPLYTTSDEVYLTIQTASGVGSSMPETKIYFAKFFMVTS